MSYFGVTVSRCYNTRMQLTNVTVAGQINTTYTYPSGTNNGKISSQYDAISGETVTYAYDSLNRLTSALGSGWSDIYGYDGFDNLATKTPTGGAPQFSQAADPTTNRLIITNVQYDNNGNPSSYNGIQLSYDAENRVVGAPLGSLQYAYDSQNKRVWKGTLSGGSSLRRRRTFMVSMARN